MLKKLFKELLLSSYYIQYFVLNKLLAPLSVRVKEESILCKIATLHHN